jgi:hypothetical protein
MGFSGQTFPVSFLRYPGGWFADNPQVVPAGYLPPLCAPLPHVWRTVPAGQATWEQRFSKKREKPVPALISTLPESYDNLKIIKFL